MARGNRNGQTGSTRRLSRVCWRRRRKAKMQFRRPAVRDGIELRCTELEHFARAAMDRRPLARPGGDELHNVAVLEAIVQSAREARRVAVSTDPDNAMPIRNPDGVNR